MMTTRTSLLVRRVTPATALRSLDLLRALSQSFALPVLQILAHFSIPQA
jgi:hypothetical protein